MSRGNHPHIDLDCFRAAQPFELLLLNRTQQFRLQFQADVADFIEEERAAVRKLEPAFLCTSAPVKAPFSWPNSSLSSSPDGMAAQFILTNVRWRLELRL